MAENKRQWSGTTAGTTWMHTSLIVIMKVVPLRLMYWFAALFVLPFCFLFNRGPVRVIAHYFGGRFGLRGFKLYRAVWMNHYRMMQVVIDRFAAYAGKRFDFVIENNEHFATLESTPEPFIVLTSHTGNCELVSYSLGSGIKPMSALVYAGEAEQIMAYRRRLMNQHGISMIAVDESFDHLFALNDALLSGHIVIMPADRVIGSTRTVPVTFMGAEARFPIGPFATAVQRDIPTIALFMMKESGRRYTLIVRRIAIDSSHAGSMRRNEKIEALVKEFARNLEEIMYRYPYQWYNYFDFWNEMT